MQHFYVNFTFPFDLLHNFFIKTNKDNGFFARKRDDREEFHQNRSASLKSYEHYYPPKLEVLTATAVALSFFVKSLI